MTCFSQDQPELIARLQQHVDRLAGLIGPRHAGRPQSLTAAATLIEREFTSSGYSVARQSYVVREQEVVNLIAELPGAQRPEQIVRHGGDAPRRRRQCLGGRGASGSNSAHGRPAARPYGAVRGLRL